MHSTVERPGAVLGALHDSGLDPSSKTVESAYRAGSPVLEERWVCFGYGVVEIAFVIGTSHRRAANRGVWGPPHAGPSRFWREHQPCGRIPRKGARLAVIQLKCVRASWHIVRHGACDTSAASLYIPAGPAGRLVFGTV